MAIFPLQMEWTILKYVNDNIIAKFDPLCGHGSFELCCSCLQLHDIRENDGQTGI